MQKKLLTKKKYNELLKTSIDAVNEHNILFLSDVAAYLPITRTEFYLYELDLAPALKDAIENQRALAKQLLIQKWMKSESPTLNIALYKLIGTQAERLALAGKSGDDDDFSKTKQAFLESLEQMGDEDESD